MKRLDWYNAMRARGHLPMMQPSGELDTAAGFYHDEDGLEHSGPMCVTCGWMACIHCEDEDVADIVPSCTVKLNDEQVDFLVHRRALLSEQLTIYSYLRRDGKLDDANPVHVADDPWVMVLSVKEGVVKAGAV